MTVHILYNLVWLFLDLTNNFYDENKAITSQDLKKVDLFCIRQVLF